MKPSIVRRLLGEKIVGENVRYTFSSEVPPVGAKPLEDHNRIPPIQELFRIFKQVNIDCLKTGESVVDFTDTEFYANQIDAMWEGNDEKVVDAAASALRDYAKAQGYVLPKRKVKESPDTPADLVESMLSEEGQGGLALRELGFAPLTPDERAAFQGASDESVLLDYSGNGFSCTFIYDFSQQQLEAISQDAESIGLVSPISPHDVVRFVKNFLSFPSEKHLRRQFTRFGEPSAREEFFDKRVPKSEK